MRLKNIDYEAHKTIKSKFSAGGDFFLSERDIEMAREQGYAILLRGFGEGKSRVVHLGHFEKEGIQRHRVIKDKKQDIDLEVSVGTAITLARLSLYSRTFGSSLIALLNDKTAASYSVLASWDNPSKFLGSANLGFAEMYLFNKSIASPYLPAFI